MAAPYVKFQNFITKRRDVYYDITGTTNLGAGNRIYFYVGARSNWVDVTDGFGRNQLHALAGCFRRVGRWTENVDCWLEAGLAPDSLSNVKSDIAQIQLPV